MSATIIIEPTGKEAARLLAGLHAQCFNRPGDETWSERAFSDVLGMPGAFGFLAIREEGDLPSPVGFAVCRTAKPEGELLSLGVIPQERRHGLAARLIDFCLNTARNRGVETLFLEVAEDNPGAQALYESCGFEQVGRRPGYYARLQGRRVDALTLKRPTD